MLLPLCPHTLSPLCILILHNKATNVSWILCHPWWQNAHGNGFYLVWHISEPLIPPHLLRWPWARHPACLLDSSLLLSTYNPSITPKISSKAKTLHLTEKKKAQKPEQPTAAKSHGWNCVTFAIRHCQHWQFIHGNRDFRTVSSECTTHQPAAAPTDTLAPF